MNRRHFLFLLSFLISISSVRAQTLTSTNLPIVVISTSGGTIADTQIMSSFKIIDNGAASNHPTDAPAFQGNIGIKLRGSAANAKRSYNIETWSGWKVAMDTALLGMPPENDWVLLANYTDRSLMRDLIGFYLFAQMGHYAPRMRLVEVLLDNNYEGVYLFGEKIKRDTGRLNIARLKNTDASGEQLTGGYIFKLDNSNDAYWESDYAPPYASGSQTIKFHYDEPQDNEITPVQKVYINSYTDSFENALQGPDYQDTLLGWRRFAAQGTFEDFLIFNEVIKNSDAYRAAAYMYKDKGKKLRVGPPWDLELSLYNTTNCNAAQDTGWAFRHSAACSTDDYLAPFWWQRLMTDSSFMKQAKCKYTNYRASLLDTASIFHFIDSIVTLLNAEQAQDRNFIKWPVMGTPIPLLNEPAPISTTYAQEVNKIKGFITRRFQYLDNQWLTPGCTLGVRNVTGNLANASVYPNPANESFNVSFRLTHAAKLVVLLRDIYGRTVMQQLYEKLPAGEHRFNYPVTGLAAGFYTVNIVTDDLVAGSYKLVKQ